MHHLLLLDLYHLCSYIILIIEELWFYLESNYKTKKLNLSLYQLTVGLGTPSIKYSMDMEESLLKGSKSSGTLINEGSLLIVNWALFELTDETSLDNCAK